MNPATPDTDDPMTGTGIGTNGGMGGGMGGGGRDLWISHVLPATRDERGGGSTVMLVLGTLLAVLMVAGLVVDGGRKVSAAADATSVAGQAARAAANAAATSELAGQATNTSAGAAAAATYFAQAGVTGSVIFSAGQVTATVTKTRPTVFLSLIGVTSVQGHGTATVSLYATGQQP